MRARKHEQRSVLAHAIVEVKPHRQHPLENWGRCLHMQHSSLARPWSPAGNLRVRADAKRDVLVPKHRPVRIRSLVEENTAHGTSRADDWLDQRADTGCQCTDSGNG